MKDDRLAGHCTSNVGVANSVSAPWQLGGGAQAAFYMFKNRKLAYLRQSLPFYAKTSYDQLHTSLERTGSWLPFQKRSRMLQNWRLLDFHPLFIADNVAMFFANFFSEIEPVTFSNVFSQLFKEAN